MMLALRELRRCPGRFSIATVILTLVALLLIFLGGLLDGLINNSVAAVTAQNGDVIVYSARAENSLVRSRLTANDRAMVEAAPGVTEVGGIGVVQLGARLPGRRPRDLVDVALFGYEIAPRGVPATPGAGQAYADDTLERDGVKKGMTLLIGPARSSVLIIGIVSHTTYLGQGSLWASPATWRAVQNANRPDAFVADGVFQAFVVQGSGGAELAAAVDHAAGGATLSLTVAAAADKLPGVQQQRTVFNQIIGVTVVIALVVVALFFALLTIERTGLYGILKAIGAKSRILFGGLLLQAVIVSAVASIIAGVAAVTLDAVIPAGAIPFELSTGRLLSSVGFLLVAAMLGCAFSLRRVLHVDPAAAIGNAL
jgi:putative ABC transport system permease protein